MIKSNKFSLLVLVGIVALGIGAWVGNSRMNSAPVEGLVTVKMPSSFSDSAAKGADLFAKNCQSCHGVAASGSNQGPPLIHKIYESSHHADGAFFRAARMGVRAHHWRFGNMPPVQTVTDEDVALIVRYIREVQMANGIL